MKNTKTLKRVICIILAVISALAFLFATFIVVRLTVAREYFSYQWGIRTINKYYYKELTDDDYGDYSLREIGENVLDQYSQYYTKAEYNQVISSNSGSRSGVGISYQYIDTSFGKGIYVISVAGNSPAYKSGLMAGTFVTGASYTSGDTETTVEFSSINDISAFIGERETGENFKLITDKGSYEMAKENYITSYSFMSTNSAAYEITYNNSTMIVTENTKTERIIDYLPDGVAYMSLSQFYGNSAYEMAQLISRFNSSGCETLILDLRNNGGGYVDLMRRISSLFILNREGYSKVAMSAKYKSGKVETSNIINFATEDCILSADTKVYVLANSRTASASEALIGVLVSNGVVDYSDIYLSDYSDEYMQFTSSTKNKQTYGKGIMQSPFVNLFTGEVLKLTTAEIFWPNGISIHDRGLTESDGCKTVASAWYMTYGDTELQSVVKDIWGQ